MFLKFMCKIYILKKVEKKPNQLLLKEKGKYGNDVFGFPKKKLNFFWALENHQSQERS